jgi:ribose transport system permease protein
MGGITINRIASRYGAFLLLILLVLFNAIFTDNFINLSTLWNVVIQTFPIIIIGLGMTMVIATGGIDISIGATMAFAAAIMGKMFDSGAGFNITIALALLGTALFGAFNGFLIAGLNIQPIIVTLILLTSGRGIAQLVNDGNIVSLFSNPISQLSAYRLGGQIPVQTLVMLILFALVYWVMKRMSFGRYVEAIGGNERVARLSGVSIFKTKFLVYVLVAVFAGIASVFETSRIAAADPNKIGRLMELDVIAAVIVGGTAFSGGRANVIGTIIGAVVIQLITITVNMQNIQYNYSLVLKAAVIIVALWLQRDRSE